MEKRGIQTNIGNLNRDIKAANSLMQSIRQMVRHLKGWIADLKEKKAALLEALQESKEPTAGAAGEISGFAPGGTYRLDKQRPAYRQRCRFQQGYGSYPLSAGKGAVHCAEFGRLSGYRQRAGRFHPAEMKPKEQRMKEINTLLSHIANFEAHKPVHVEYAAIRFKKPREQFAAAHRDELDAIMPLSVISRCI